MLAKRITPTLLLQVLAFIVAAAAFYVLLVMLAIFIQNELASMSFSGLLACFIHGC